MKRSETIGALSKALSAMQGEVVDGIRDSKGGHGKYADLAQILQIVRPLLAKHKLSFSQFPSSSEHGVTVVSLLAHESGEWIESELTLKPAPARNGSEAQAQGTVITYNRRYQISSIFAISQEDSDAEVNREYIKSEKSEKIKQFKQAEAPPELAADMQPIGKDKAMELVALIKESGSNEDNVMAYASKDNEFDGIQNMPLCVFLNVQTMLIKRIDKNAKAVKALAAKLKKEAKKDG